MPITIFDGIVIGVLLFSAVLAMVRGFSREILSIVSWGGSAVAAYYLYPLLVPYALQYKADTKIATIASAGVIFLLALIIISFITIRIADFIIDSRIGALDRTLGFLFGAARGLLLMVVVVAFWNWLVAPAARPDWVRSVPSVTTVEGWIAQAKTLPTVVTHGGGATAGAGEPAGGGAAAVPQPVAAAAAPPPSASTSPAGRQGIWARIKGFFGR